MSLYYDGQPEALRTLMAEAQLRERDYLQTRHDISRRAVEALLDAGGVTTSESDFTLAMHGFSRGDAMTPSVHGLFAYYDLVRDRFSGTERLPVATVPDNYAIGSGQLLESIGIISARRRGGGWRQEESPLQYRIKGSSDYPRGTIELPVDQLHEWSGHMWDMDAAQLTLNDEETVVVAGVLPTANPEGTVPRSVEEVFGIVPYVRVGWKAILGSYEFDEKAHPSADKVFMDRIAIAREHFSHTHPIEIGAD